MVSKRKREGNMRIRTVHSERNADRVITGILVGLDKLVRLWYRREDDKRDMPMTVRTLKEFRDAKGKHCREGQIIMVTASHPELGRGVVYPRYYPGTQLDPSEYEIMIPEGEFNKLLKGNE